MTIDSAAIPNTADRAQIAERAQALGETLRASTSETEAARSVAPGAVEAIQQAGLLRILVPGRLGGYEAGLPAMVDAVSAVARADAASGWMLLVLTAHDWMLGMFPEQCQQEVYAAGPDVRVSGGLASQGRAEPVEGGWRVSGRWQFGSGVDQGDWSLLGAVQATADGEDPKNVHVVVPRSDYRVDDTWFTLGLRGTGSKDILLDEVFVPAHRSLPTGALFGGRGPGIALHDDASLYRIPVLSGLAVHLGAASLGIARAGLDAFIAQTTARRHTYTGVEKAESPGLQLRVAESLEELHAAELLVYDLCERLSAAAALERIPSATRAQLMWQGAYLVQLCRRAVSRVFEAAGAKSVQDTSALQKAFRDINTAAHHATIDPDDTAITYGRVAFGLRPNSILL